MPDRVAAFRDLDDCARILRFARRGSRWRCSVAGCSGCRRLADWPAAGYGSLGPDPELVGVAAARLATAGWRSGDAVVLAAASSSDPRALVDVRAAARLLRVLVGRRVRIGYVASAAPRVGELVAGRGRASGRGGVVAARRGDLQRWLHDCGADVLAGPLGPHRGVVNSVVARYNATLAGSDPVAAWPSAPGAMIAVLVARRALSERLPTETAIRAGWGGRGGGPGRRRR